MLFRSGGYEVRSAGDGRKAIELARESRPDLFLLDLDLPEMDGVGTLAALREIEGLCEAPAVFLTAIATPQVTQRLRSLGALDVLGKPFRPRDLVQSLNRALGQALA